MDVKKVLFITQEITPYLPASQIANVGKNLPQGIQEKGYEVRTFMPKFGSINERRNQLHEVIRLSGMNLIIDDTDHPLIIKVATLQPARMQVYFIDNDDYFQKRAGETSQTEQFREDNDERCIFFVRGVMETVKKLRWEPDVIHCHGWMTALAPLYIKKAYKDDPSFRNSKVVYSVYDSEFQESFDPKFYDKLKLDGVEDSDITFKPNDNVDFTELTKLAIAHSDGVIQSSENINSKVLKYIEDSKMPFLGYKNDEEYINSFEEFYKNL